MPTFIGELRADEMLPADEAAEDEEADGHLCAFGKNVPEKLIK